jgi:hypothetical protein
MIIDSNLKISIPNNLTMDEDINQKVLDAIDNLECIYIRSNGNIYTYRHPAGKIFNSNIEWIIWLNAHRGSS